MNNFHSSVNSFSRTLSSYFDEKLSRFNLATSYIELMILMKENNEVSQKEIAEQLSLAPSTITRFVDKLKKEGYLTKKRDGRNMTIELTQNGRQVSSEMEREYQAAVQEIRGLMGDKYLETVGKLLEYGNEELEKAAVDS
ncbi:MarR family winged helix-turn-helix transcriptional regulator [Rhodohalobacter sp. 8-1]|uniref:MarR family winged helix-turn-helix transcriptional regulator n=1 Tax=Rhodohalobacter sp. 8-1 TaxID=3131972 RepID=UPI0030EBAC9B